MKTNTSAKLHLSRQWPKNVEMKNEFLCPFSRDSTRWADQECIVTHCVVLLVSEHHYKLVFPSVFASRPSVSLWLRLNVSKLSASLQNLLTTWADSGVLQAGWHWLVATRRQRYGTVSSRLERTGLLTLNPSSHFQNHNFKAAHFQIQKTARGISK